MERLHGSISRRRYRTLKNQPRSCLAGASRFGQPEIQSTLKFVYGRKRASKKEERRRRKGRQGRHGWREKSGNFPRATIDARCRKEWKMAGGLREKERERAEGGRGEAASKMCGPFFRHEPVVPGDNNEDTAQWRSRSPRLLCASFHVREIIPFLRFAQFPRALPSFTRSKFVDTSASVNIDETLR